MYVSSIDLGRLSLCVVQFLWDQHELVGVVLRILMTDVNFPWYFPIYFLESTFSEHQNSCLLSKDRLKKA